MMIGHVDHHHNNVVACSSSLQQRRNTKVLTSSFQYTTVCMALLLMVVVSISHIPYTYGRSILGIDLGSLYMKVALVQSGNPIEIVTNLHSKRKTEQMILFDNMQRFYGADAAALLQRKAHTTPTAMSLMLGRNEQHPIVQV